MKVSTFVVLVYLLFLTTAARADVAIENGGINSFSSVTAPGSTMNLDVESGAGQAGNYIVLSCAAFNNNNSNTFNAPSPAIFTQHDLDNCGPSLNCVSGIWGGFTNNPASETLTCNSAEPTIVFAAGTLRYSNVDDVSPLIDIMCNEGMSNLATAPSINTEAGSQVIRIFNSFAFTEDVFDDIVIGAETASFSSEATVDGVQVSTIGSSMLVNSDGPTGTLDQAYSGPERNWRACTLALRMLPEPTPEPTIEPTQEPTASPTVAPPPPPDVTRNVPTLSQWGHLSVVIITLLVGIWFLRRKSKA